MILTSLIFYAEQFIVYFSHLPFLFAISNFNYYSLLYIVIFFSWPKLALIIAIVVFSQLLKKLIIMISFFREFPIDDCAKDGGKEV